MSDGAIARQGSRGGETALVSVDRLTKRFHRALSRRSFTAVSDVSLAVRRGSIYGLVGESGSGKTTLARSMLFLDPPTSGEVRFAGAALGALDRRELRRLRARMQIVFQDPNGALNPRLPIRTSLLEGVSNLPIDRAERERRVLEACEQVGIAESHLSRKPGAFSGGQKQRIVIARALTMRPEFLVLDEPVSNLDVSIQAQIINLLIDLKERLDLTYLFISHDLNLVGYLCDTIAVMHAGRIVEIGNAGEILERPLHVYTRRLFASSARIVDHEASDAATASGEGARGKLLVGGGPVVADSGAGCAFSKRCSIATSRCMTGKPEFRWSSPDHGIACFEAQDTDGHDP